MKITSTLQGRGTGPVFAIAFLAGTLFLTAQPATPGAIGGRPNRNGGAGGNINAQGPRAAALLGLDSQQLDLYREASQKDIDQLRRLDDRLRIAQKELMQAAIAEKYDDKTVQDKAEAVSKVQVEITLLRARALSAVAPTLKPDQREQLENSRAGAAMLSAGGGPGGGGGAAAAGGRAAGRQALGGRRAANGQ